MLNDLNHGCRIESGKSFVPIRQRAMQEPDAALLPSGQSSNRNRSLAISSDRKATSMPTISSNCFSLRSSRSSFPSPQPRSTTRFAPDALNAAATIPRRCSLRLIGFSSDSSRPPERASTRPSCGLVVLFGKPCQGLSGKTVSVLEVAMGDRLPFGVRCQPALSVFQQLLQFLLADVVVLEVVEDRESGRKDA